LAGRRVAQLGECLCQTVFSLDGRHQSRSRAAWRRGRREEGRGEKSPNKEGSDVTCPFPLYFFSSPTLSKPSELRYFVPSPFRRSHSLGIPHHPPDFAGNQSCVAPYPNPEPSKPRATRANWFAASLTRFVLPFELLCQRLSSDLEK
jgi:hypothetical protein